MRVEVEVVCAPYPQDGIETALRAAGRDVAVAADSVSVDVLPGEPARACLSFEMARAVQYKAVDQIVDAIKFWAWAFYEDLTIRFL